MGFEKNPDDLLSPEQRKLRKHLREKLLALHDLDGRGFTPAEANYLIDHGVDWRDVKRLLDEGCDLDTCRMIVL